MSVITGAVTETPKGRYRLLIRPNQSLSVQAMIGVLLGFGLVLLGVGLWFVWRGMWLVLPIAGLEFAVLVLAFVVTTRRAKDFDMVVVDDHKVRITKVFNGIETYEEFQRTWAQVNLVKPPHHWLPTQLMIGSHGVWVEVGKSMTEPSRRALTAQLQLALNAHSGLEASDPATTGNNGSI